jgi:formamidopyrimidine-DNA glycosylase
MPELPDIELYRAALTQRLVGNTLRSVRARSPFFVRSVEPPIDAAIGRGVTDIRRIGKRIILCFERDLFWVIHLMIAGRLRWIEPGGKGPPSKIELAQFTFEPGTLCVTEAGTKKRASLHVVRGESELVAFNPGGIEPLTISYEQFAAALKAENHTLKRSLTDPHVFAGIGNAYSDEILHAARLSPLKQTGKMDATETRRLYEAIQATLRHWVAKLQAEFAEDFPGPGDVTAFRPDFAVHGKFNKPCPVCGTKVQRIRYADNETNYCPRCQTEGKVLADRSLSRLLKKDWPATIDELEK